ncbi:TonB-dependent receptor domain-containing protein [Pseudoduganella violaceinigra]|uniref:TonB-dependent receptor domain-containing protein n=1 Tax=Pseudoduganella violaceinigra TaxID=246602 RepID=UPI00040AD3A2|nr:TonB-dependent receptor [Pseudoduganella violaceinigra]
MKSKPNLNKSAIAAAVAVAFAAPAFAQQGAATPTMQRVEITGSSIKRVNNENAGSLQVLNRADIERTGATTALEVLRSASAIDTSLNSATSSSGSFAPGSSAVQLRSLGKVATLVLVNGRRIAPYGLSDGGQDNFTNLDAIASESIERIEILKDGASAIYGSDAIAGVVNIILRKDYTGARIKANYTEAPKFKDQRTRNVAAIFGYGDVDTDGFNTYLSVEGYRADGWSRGELRRFVPDWHGQTPTGAAWDAKSTYSPTGNYWVNNKPTPAPGCPADAMDAGACKWDVLPYDGQTTDNERWALVSNTHFRIGKSIDATLEITSSGAKTDYIVPPFTTPSPTSTYLWYNAVEGHTVGPFSYPKLPVGHAMNPYNVPVEYRARLMDTGNGFNFNRTNSEQARYMLTLNGSVGKYDWKSAFGQMTSEATKETRNASAKGYTDAIVKGAYKFGQQNDPALLDAMFPVRSTAGRSKTTFIDGTITGEAMQLPAGPLSFAVGADIRRQHYEMASSDNVLRGELVSVFGLQVNDTVNQYALFGEAVIPVFKRLEMTAALRADKTDKFDAHLSPKLGLKFTPTDSLLFRATASGGFRAPNINETGNGLGRGSVSTNVNDPRRCPTAAALNDLVQKAAGATSADKARAKTLMELDCKGSLSTFVSANSELKPETSKTFTVGVVWEPIKNTSFSLDYYNIKRKDEIGTREVPDLLNAEASLPAGMLVRVDNTAQDNEFLGIVNKYVPGNTKNFGGVGSLGLAYRPYVNSGKTKVDGFDFDASTRVKLDGIGELRVKLEGEYKLHYQIWNVGTNSYNPNQYGTWDYGFGRWNVKVRPSLTVGAWDHGVTMNYRSAANNNSYGNDTYCVTQKVAPENMGACEKVKRPVIFDYNLRYSGIQHLTLSMYVNNVFDRQQAVRWRDGWSFTSTGFRTVGVSAAYDF